MPLLRLGRPMNLIPRMLSVVFSLGLATGLTAAEAAKPTPASTMRRATSATRRTFSARSPGVKPRSLVSPERTLSPSRTKVRTPSRCSRRSTRFAIVDLPDPDSPVNHTARPR